MDIGDLWGQVSGQIENQWNDAKVTLVPALEASLETQAAQALTGMAKTSTQTATAGANMIASRPPPPPGSFGATFSGIIGNIGTSVGGAKYGLPIVLGGVALVVVIYWAAKK
jgi:hypothetical protein